MTYERKPSGWALFCFTGGVAATLAVLLRSREKRAGRELAAVLDLHSRWLTHAISPAIKDDAVSASSESRAESITAVAVPPLPVEPPLRRAERDLLLHYNARDSAASNLA